MNQELVYKAAKAMCLTDLPDDGERLWELDPTVRRRYVASAMAGLEAIGLKAVIAGGSDDGSMRHQWATDWVSGRPKWLMLGQGRNVRGTGEAAASADPQERRCNKTEDLVGDGSQPAREAPS
jgi:hypothetical protein